MYLVRMHSDRAAHERVQCADLRAEAKLLLNAESARRAAPGQAAAQPAPNGASPNTTAPNGGSPVQDSSGARKRPRGPAPRGKSWHDTQGWVDISPAACAAGTANSPSPSPPNVRLGGRPKKKLKGCCKHATPETVTADENRPSQQQETTAWPTVSPPKRPRRAAMYGAN